MSIGEYFRIDIWNFLFSTTVYYPLYRTFSQYRLAYITNNFKPEIIEIAQKLIKSNGIYRGLMSYSISNIIMLAGYWYNDSREGYSYSAFLFMTIPAFILQYPFHLNSSRRALNLPGYVNLYHPKKLLELIRSSKNYKGIIAYSFSTFTFFIPFVNLLSHGIESARLAYVFGEHYGQNFSSTRAARSYMLNTSHDCFKRGWLHYNIFPYIYNAFYISNYLHSKE